MFNKVENSENLNMSYQRYQLSKKISHKILTGKLILFRIFFLIKYYSLTSLENVMKVGNVRFNATCAEL